MARPVRVEFENAVCHVTVRGNERKTIYRDPADRQRFLDMDMGSIWGQLLTRDRIAVSAQYPSMARPVRVEFENAVYHVTARGNELKDIYPDPADRQDTDTGSTLDT